MKPDKTGVQSSSNSYQNTRQFTAYVPLIWGCSQSVTASLEWTSSNNMFAWGPTDHKLRWIWHPQGLIMLLSPWQAVSWLSHLCPRTLPLQGLPGTRQPAGSSHPQVFGEKSHILVSSMPWAQARPRALGSTTPEAHKEQLGLIAPTGDSLPRKKKPSFLPAKAQANPSLSSQRTSPWCCAEPLSSPRTEAKGAPTTSKFLLQYH